MSVESTSVPDGSKTTAAPQMGAAVCISCDSRIYNKSIRPNAGANDELFSLASTSSLLTA